MTPVSLGHVRRRLPHLTHYARMCIPLDHCGVGVGAEGGDKGKEREKRSEGEKDGWMGRERERERERERANPREGNKVGLFLFLRHSDPFVHNFHQSREL